MKKIAFVFTVLVLTSAVLTACGCRNSQPMNTTVPTTMPTTAPATIPTTVPTEQTNPTTTPSTQETIEDGNGPLPTNATAGADGDTSTATDDTSMEGRSRTMPRNNEK